ncbi:caspase domain-containing protein [Archangium gephyra]|uniref:Caspase domain-containing protein n=1 Tax=Archangium gephyra TaxID=48 RepID=A0ABX9JWW2_9BACT|nr:caspase family protein [Archangium gephyra]REG28645.1 caspase domain-containing protein [Archangium gephyra]
MAYIWMKRLAIVVGIDAYPPPQSRLSGCVGDAQRFARFLRSACGGSFDQVTLVKNESATLENLRGVLRWAANDTWEQVVVYFAGHGSHQGILAWDGLMEFTELAFAIRSIRADWHLLVLDACQAGAVHQYFDGVAGLPAPDDSAAIYLELLQRAHPGLRVLTAVDRQTNAKERNAQGVFTTALLKAARSAWPDLSEQGVSAARILSEAAALLHGNRDPLPQGSGDLDDLPMALTDVHLPLGGAWFRQEPMQLPAQPGAPLSARFEYTVRITGRQLLPTTVSHVVHDGAGWSHTAAPLRVLPATNDVTQPLFVSLPLGQMPMGRKLQSVVTVVDERKQHVGQHRANHPGLWLKQLAPLRPVRVLRP